jgi:hypothetical protein
VSVSFGGELLGSRRYRSQRWDEAPVTTEREIPSLDIFAEGIESIPAAR